ncbi:homeobox-leucine zipper protein PROTODERMAL FACTOR 2-like [Asparagus officinalis]|uniref:homeobox-leucine zipper protein PROTODERMAL FACTOR 2-like n=1 Tax=Asparagus officinalis TaxID=4686 RepID=UPI00098E21F3|nr:homeobox-leucine zipper protein PROTODERMAL FACTOR 2-like [Asparagus officinalis]
MFKPCIVFERDDPDINQGPTIEGNCIGVPFACSSSFQQPISIPGPSNFFIPNGANIENSTYNAAANGTTESTFNNTTEVLENHANVFTQIAEAAADELLIMAQTGQPLWLPAAGPENYIEILNEGEYLLSVSKWAVPNSFGFTREATRAVTMVNMNAFRLVEILCDAKKWSALFSGVVLRATTMEVHSRGRNYNGAMQVISAEYQLPSPLVPTRDILFLRYCKKLPLERTWVVVDVSLDLFRSDPAPNRCQKRPSGCIIEEIEEQTIKVIWVEHVEINVQANFVHAMYKPIVSSGIGFGARRWLAMLGRQSDRIANAMNCNIPYFSEFDAERATRGTSPGNNVLKLAERMVLSFYAGLACSLAHGWVNEFGDGTESVKIASKRNVGDPRMPSGVIVNASVSFWVPAMPKRVFDFLCDESSRDKWDSPSEREKLVPVVLIPTGIESGNYISILKQANDKTKHKKKMFIQESCFDNTCSYLIYAPVSKRSVNVCIHGGDQERIQLLPSGVTIVPDGPYWMTNGSLVTVSIQILSDSNPQTDVNPGSVELVNNLVMSVVDSIKIGVVDENQ